MTDRGGETVGRRPSRSIAIATPAHPPFRALIGTLALLLTTLPAATARPGGDAAEVAAVRRLLRQESPSARAAAVRRLAGRGDPASTELLLRCLDDPHPYVRRAAAGVLGAVGFEAVHGLGRRIRRLRAPRARREACRTGALWAAAAGRRLLLDLARDPAREVRAEAIRWLGHDPDPAVTEAIVGRLKDTAGLVRAEALDALRDRADAFPPWTSHLRDTDPRVRLSALEGSVASGSGMPGGGTAAVAVAHGLQDAVWSVRLRAAELSRAAADRAVLHALAQRLTDERRRVARAAHEALVEITGIPFDPDVERWVGWLEGDGASFDPASAAGARPPESVDRGPPRRGHTVAAARFLDLPVLSRHVGFVLDRSGSMARRVGGGESRWARVVRELGVVLGHLGKAHVNVYLFAETAEPVFPSAVPLTAARRKTLERRLAATRPAGRTALFDGIAAALADPELDTLVVLSDGAPSAGAFFTKTDLLLEIRRLNRWRRARIDVISIAHGAIARRWRGALRRLAEDHGGIYLAR